MNPQELRLGNYVHRLDYDLTDDSYHATGEKDIVRVDLDILGNIIDGNENLIKGVYEPIPLSNELLHKLGFIIIKDSEEFFLGDFRIFLPNFFKYKDCVLNKIKYVHQLQNLFYALTGKELTLKTEL